MNLSLPPAANRMPSVLPLLGCSLLSTLVVLATVCLSLSREEETVRFPTGTLPRPPTVRETATVSVRILQNGVVTFGGQAVEGSMAAAWRRERAALQLLGLEPSQATVAVRADRDVPTDRVQRLMEQAQEAGFSRCVLRPADDSAPSQALRGPER